MATKFWSDTQFDESCTFQNTAEFNGSCTFQDATWFNEDVTHSENINIIPNISFSFSLSASDYVSRGIESATDYSYEVANITRSGKDISGAILTDYTILTLTISPTKQNSPYDIKIISNFANPVGISIGNITQTSSATNTFSNLSGKNKLTITLSGSLLAAMDQGTIICNSINISIYPQGSGQLILKGVSGKFIVKNDGINIVDESTGINKTPISVQGTKVIATSDELYLSSFASKEKEVGSYLTGLNTQVLENVIAIQDLETRLNEQGFKSAPATSIFFILNNNKEQIVEDIKCRIHQSGALVEIIFDETSNFLNVINNWLEKPLYITSSPITSYSGDTFYLKKPTAKRSDITSGWTEQYTIKMNVTNDVTLSELFQVQIYYPNNTGNKPYIIINRYKDSNNYITGQLTTAVGVGDNSAIVWRTIN